MKKILFVFLAISSVSFADDFQICLINKELTRAASKRENSNIYYIYLRNKKCEETETVQRNVRSTVLEIDYKNSQEFRCPGCQQNFSIRYNSEINSKKD